MVASGNANVSIVIPTPNVDISSYRPFGDDFERTLDKILTEEASMEESREEDWPWFTGSDNPSVSPSTFSSRSESHARQSHYFTDSTPSKGKKSGPRRRIPATRHITVIDLIEDSDAESSPDSAPPSATNFPSDGASDQKENKEQASHIRDRKKAKTRQPLKDAQEEIHKRVKKFLGDVRNKAASYGISELLIDRLIHYVQKIYFGTDNPPSKPARQMVIPPVGDDAQRNESAKLNTSTKSSKQSQYSPQHSAGKNARVQSALSIPETNLETADGDVIQSSTPVIGNSPKKSILKSRRSGHKGTYEGHDTREQHPNVSGEISEDRNASLCAPIDPARHSSNTRLVDEIPTAQAKANVSIAQPIAMAKTRRCNEKKRKRGASDMQDSHGTSDIAKQRRDKRRRERHERRKSGHHPANSKLNTDEDKSQTTAKPAEIPPMGPKTGTNCGSGKTGDTQIDPKLARKQKHHHVKSQAKVPPSSPKTPERQIRPSPFDRTPRSRGTPGSFHRSPFAILSPDPAKWDMDF
ncbi:hypothetical protein N7450_000932 [Penicillium hetheringtonii]|uniref:Uncharacterized protein n=1 Tax=Penicillium hetheringtonii TaxID=911720 RepID=A0AAD6H324_9EURO|nr:hypothetical protein N7450_000932 [Penicillium hetheringtonii]